jgi:UDP-GlcNAc3NAcA epimerase
MSKKILTVLGARPQFIKASAVSAAIAEPHVPLREVVVHTGQHFDANMSEVFFTELGMERPAHELAIHGGSHGEMTGRMLVEIERVLQTERPDVVMVYGDTNSTLAGAIAAIKLHIPVAHVEAGLRSFNMKMPEEINRIVTDRVSQWLFTPTEAADANLRNEGVAASRIVRVGDVMHDVALRNAERVDAHGRVIGRLGLRPRGYVLATVHRAENTEDLGRLEVIVGAFSRVAERAPVVWPLHPRTRAILRDRGLMQKLGGGVHVVEPVGYLDMVQLETNAAVVATDSGGVQKEAFFYRVPCVTLREETEWVELVESGWNCLAPPRSAREVADRVLSAIGSCGDEVNPYGAGDAASRIVERLLSDLAD